MSHVQKTLVVLKPDSVGRSLVGEIISRFERAGLHIIGMKMVKPTAEFLESHYEGIGKLWTRKGESVLNSVVTMMTKMPVVALCIEWVESVEYVRKMVGTTEPKSALPGTIRGDYAHISYGYVDSGDDVFFFNLIHASADADEAAQELKLWFGDDELFSDDKPVHTTFTR